MRTKLTAGKRPPHKQLAITRTHTLVRRSKRLQAKYPPTDRYRRIVYRGQVFLAPIINTDDESVKSDDS